MASKIIRNVEFLNTYPSPVLLNFTQSGAAGATGATGSAGATGATGTSGLTGPTGTYTNAQMYAFSVAPGTTAEFSSGNQWNRLIVARTILFGNLDGNSVTYENISNTYTKFTFQPGTYYITIKGVTYGNNGKIQYRLYDETNDLVLAYGLTSAGVTVTSADLFLSAVLTFTTMVNIILEVGSQFTAQLGSVVSSSFIPEVYRIMNILKIA